jgi:hypothetical protein
MNNPIVIINREQRKLDFFSICKPQQTYSGPPIKGKKGRNKRYNYERGKIG